MMDDRKTKDTQSRLYERGQEKLRKINNYEQKKKIEKEMHAMQKPSSLAGELPQGHRGPPTSSALYNLNQDKLKKLEERKMNKQQENLKLANSKFKNKESDVLRISYFKKEFRQRLTAIIGGD